MKLHVHVCQELLQVCKKYYSAPQWSSVLSKFICKHVFTADSAELKLLCLLSPNISRCGHCKRLAPIYAKAAQTMAKADPPVAFAKIDATKHEQSAGTYDITAYPMLKIFRQGEAYDYEGPTDEDGNLQLDQFFIQ